MNSLGNILLGNSVIFVWALLLAICGVFLWVYVNKKDKEDEADEEYKRDRHL